MAKNAIRNEGSKGMVDVAANTALVEIPLGELNPDHYVSRQLHVSTLSPRQASGLRRLTLGLRDAHAQLECGRHVDNTADAVRWIFEAVAQE